MVQYVSKIWLKTMIVNYYDETMIKIESVLITIAMTIIYLYQPHLEHLVMTTIHRHERIQLDKMVAHVNENIKQSIRKVIFNLFQQLHNHAILFYLIHMVLAYAQVNMRKYVEIENYQRLSNVMMETIEVMTDVQETAR